MERIKNKRQTVMIVALAWIMSIIMTFGFTFAFFSDSLQVTNTLKFGKLVLEAKDSGGSSTGETTITLTQSETFLSTDDTLTISGSIGLANNSMDSFVRLNLITSYKSVVDGSAVSVSYASDKAFKHAFLTELAKITNTVNTVERKWFIVADSKGNEYLYLGNIMTSAENGEFTYNGTITINDEMRQDDIQGCEVALTFEYQAILKAETDVTLNDENGYTSENATAIAGATGWAAFYKHIYGTFNSGTGVFTPVVDKATATHIVFGTYGGNPILWKILTTSNVGTPTPSLIMSEFVLDTKPFDYSTSINNGSVTYSSSDIRQWLNSTTTYQYFAGNDSTIYDGFLKGFTSEEVSVIKPVDVAKGLGASAATTYVASKTGDKVFLLSQTDVNTDGVCGYTKSVAADDKNRIKYTVSYSAETKKWTKGSSDSWWLRSPDSTKVYSVDSIGCAVVGNNPSNSRGVVPALFVQL